MSAPTTGRHRHRPPEDDPVWFAIPWTYQRAALWLFALFAITLTLTQPSYDRAAACLGAVLLIVIHQLMKPKPGEGCDDHEPEAHT